MDLSSSDAFQPFLLNALNELVSLPLNRPDVLFSTSSSLLETFYKALETSAETMLPSFTVALPTGREAGTAIAIDVGGSTLRVAAVELTPSSSVKGASGDPRRVLMRKEWVVRDEVKRKRSAEFFDWIAERVAEVVEGTQTIGRTDSLPVGVTWSFPIEQTSVCSGIVQKMGKGYHQWGEIHGTDLKTHFEAAFSRKNLNLHMTALLNDTEATLLSHSSANWATRISLIWGTGCNMAVLLPLTAISSRKLGKRSMQWLSAAAATEVGVMVNTEISMFGREVFPTAEYDRLLDGASDHPGFQPLEQLTSGRYLGEIARLALLRGIESKALFQGKLPGGFAERFSMDTALMADLEMMYIDEARTRIMQVYHFEETPSDQDLTVIRAICRAISERAAIIMAVTIFSLWRLQRDSFLAAARPNRPWKPPAQTIAVAFCGAVAERHPTMRERCQQTLDLLVETEPGPSPKPDTGPDAGLESFSRPRLMLESALDSGLLGAAVAALLNETRMIRPMEGKL